MEKLATRAFSSLEDLFSGEVIQEAKEIIGVTPFEMATMVHVSLFLIGALVCCDVISY